MGYARLHFANDGTIQIGNVIRDIVGVVAGDYTATNQLLAATQNLSEIVNSAGRGNWTKLYPATLGTTIPVVLSAPCLNGSTKYVQIGGCGAGDAVNNTLNTDLYIYSATGQGVYMRSCTAATSATSITKPSSTNTADTLRVTNITGNYIYLSWSSRHLIIYGNSRGTTTGTQGMSACLEFTESGIYDSRNVAPFLHVQYFESIWTNNPNYNNSFIEVMNHYVPTTGVANGAFNIIETQPVTNWQDTITLTPVYTNNAFPKANNYTKSSSGAVSPYIVPLFWNQFHLGIPNHYISDICKVYRTQVGIGNAGDTMTINGDTYVYMPIFTSSVLATPNAFITLKA